MRAEPRRESGTLKQQAAESEYYVWYRSRTVPRDRAGRPIVSLYRTRYVGNSTTGIVQ